MITVKPWEAADQSNELLSELIQSVSHKAVRSIQYGYPAGYTPESGEYDKPVHEVSMAVLVEADKSQFLYLPWAMRGEDEGIEFTLGGPNLLNQLPEIDFFDVSKYPVVSDVIGQKVEDFVISWHVPNEGCARAPWAVRMTVSGGGSLVVALGELDSNITYSPDSLVVIYDEQVAKQFTIPAGFASSWG